ncbi:MAG: hypothetical protein QOJ40_1260 [Verrucomicrobiota bacterium]
MPRFSEAKRKAPRGDAKGGRPLMENYGRDLTGGSRGNGERAEKTRLQIFTEANEGNEGETA